MNTTNPKNVPRDNHGTDAGLERDFQGIPPDIVHAGLHGLKGAPVVLPAYVYDEAVRQCPRFAELPLIHRYDGQSAYPRTAAMANPLLRALVKNRADEYTRQFIQEIKTESVIRRAVDMALQTGTAMVYKGRAIGLSEMLADPAPARAEVHLAPEPTRRLSAVAAAVAIITTPGAAA